MMGVKRRSGRGAWSSPVAWGDLINDTMAPPPPSSTGAAPLRQFAASSAMLGRRVTEDTPPDLLEGTMDLTVILPSRRRVSMTVYRSTPMMDLLIQVTTAHRISPAGHVIHVVSDARPLAYKPSTPIGTLDASILEIVPKNRVNEAKTDGRSRSSAGESCQRLKTQEWIYKQQLVVNLPRQQLAVYRVSPHTSLADALLLVCADRDYDSCTVQLRRPDKPDEELDPAQTLHDLDLHEVSLVPRNYTGPPPPLSVSDILAMSSLTHSHDGDHRSKRKSVFKLFSRKSKSRPPPAPAAYPTQSTGDSSLSSGSAGERSVSPTRSDESEGTEPLHPGAPSPPTITRTTSEHHLAQAHRTSRSNGGSRPMSMLECSSDDHSSSSATVRSGMSNRSSSNMNLSSNNRSKNISNIRKNDDGRPASVVPPLRTKKRKAPPAPPLLQHQDGHKGHGIEATSASRRSSDASRVRDAPDQHVSRNSTPTSEVSETDTTNYPPSLASVHPSGVQAAPRNRRRAPVPPKSEAPRPSAIPEESSNSKSSRAPSPHKSSVTPKKSSAIQNEQTSSRASVIQEVSTNGTDFVGSHSSMNGIHHVEVHASPEDSDKPKISLNSSIDSNSSQRSSEVSEEYTSAKTLTENNVRPDTQVFPACSRTSSIEKDEAVPKSSQTIPSGDLDTVFDQIIESASNSIAAGTTSSGDIISSASSESPSVTSDDHTSATLTSTENREKITNTSAQEPPMTTENPSATTHPTTNDTSVDVPSVVPITSTKNPSVEPAVDVAVGCPSSATVPAASTSAANTSSNVPASGVFVVAPTTDPPSVEPSLANTSSKALTAGIISASLTHNSPSGDATTSGTLNKAPSPDALMDSTIIIAPASHILTTDDTLETSSPDSRTPDTKRNSSGPECQDFSSNTLSNNFIMNGVAPSVLVGTSNTANNNSTVKNTACNTGTPSIIAADIDFDTSKRDSPMTITSSLSPSARISLSTKHLLLKQQAARASLLPPSSISNSLPPPSSISNSLPPPSSISNSLPPPSSISNSLPPPSSISNSLPPPSSISNSTSHNSVPESGRKKSREGESDITTELLIVSDSARSMIEADHLETSESLQIHSKLSNCISSDSDNSLPNSDSNNSCIFPSNDLNSSPASLTGGVSDSTDVIVQLTNSQLVTTTKIGDLNLNILDVNVYTLAETVGLKVTSSLKTPIAIPTNGTSIGLDTTLASHDCKSKENKSVDLPGSTADSDLSKLNTFVKDDKLISTLGISTINGLVHSKDRLFDTNHIHSGFTNDTPTSNNENAPTPKSPHYALSSFPSESIDLKTFKPKKTETLFIHEEQAKTVTSNGVFSHRMTETISSPDSSSACLTLAPTSTSTPLQKFSLNSVQPTPSHPYLDKTIPNTKSNSVDHSSSTLNPILNIQQCRVRNSDAGIGSISREPFLFLNHSTESFPQAYEYCEKSLEDIQESSSEFLIGYLDSSSNDSHFSAVEKSDKVVSRFNTTTNGEISSINLREYIDLSFDAFSTENSISASEKVNSVIRSTTESLDELHRSIMFSKMVEDIDMDLLSLLSEECVDSSDDDCLHQSKRAIDNDCKCRPISPSVESTLTSLTETVCPENCIENTALNARLASAMDRSMSEDYFSIGDSFSDPTWETALDHDTSYGSPFSSRASMYSDEDHEVQRRSISLSSESSVDISGVTSLHTKHEANHLRENYSREHETSSHNSVNSETFDMKQPSLPAIEYDKHSLQNTAGPVMENSCLKLNDNYAVHEKEYREVEGELSDFESENLSDKSRSTSVASSEVVDYRTDSSMGKWQREESIERDSQKVDEIFAFIESHRDDEPLKEVVHESVSAESPKSEFSVQETESNNQQNIRTEAVNHHIDISDDSYEESHDNMKIEPKKLKEDEDSRTIHLESEVISLQNEVGETEVGDVGKVYEENSMADVQSNSVGDVKEFVIAELKNSLDDERNYDYDLIAGLGKKSYTEVYSSSPSEVRKRGSYKRDVVKGRGDSASSYESCQQERKSGSETSYESAPPPAPEISPPVIEQILSNDASIDEIQIEEAKPQTEMPKTRTVEVKPQAVEVKLQAVEVKPQAVEVKPQAVEVKPQAVEVKPQAVEVKPQAVEVKPWVVEVAPNTIELNRKTQEMKHETQEFKRQTQELKIRTLESERRAEDTKLWADEPQLGTGEQMPSIEVKSTLTSESIASMKDRTDTNAVEVPTLTNDQDCLTREQNRDKPQNGLNRVSSLSSVDSDSGIGMSSAEYKHQTNFSTKRKPIVFSISTYKSRAEEKSYDQKISQTGSLDDPEEEIAIVDDPLLKKQNSEPILQPTYSVTKISSVSSPEIISTPTEQTSGVVSTCAKATSSETKTTIPVVNGFHEQHATLPQSSLKTDLTYSSLPRNFSNKTGNNSAINCSNGLGRAYIRSDSSDSATSSTSSLSKLSSLNSDHSSNPKLSSESSNKVQSSVPRAFVVPPVQPLRGLVTAKPAPKPKPWLSTSAFTATPWSGTARAVQKVAPAKTQTSSSGPEPSKVLSEVCHDQDNENATVTRGLSFNDRRAVFAKNGGQKTVEFKKPLKLPAVSMRQWEQQQLQHRQQQMQRSTSLSNLHSNFSELKRAQSSSCLDEQSSAQAVDFAQANYWLSCCCSLKVAIDDTSESSSELLGGPSYVHEWSCLNVLVSTGRTLYSAYVI
ncbi:Cordon-bleu ubiquitin-like domain [Trinorchestia longiramus]|nr:Cordon-bleu ubiquitin-like domain [Trinorchestia longiramus]